MIDNILSELTERLTLNDGIGAICVKGDSFDCSIHFSGHPYAINWSDCGGSVAQYLARVGTRNTGVDLAQARHAVANGFDDSLPMSSQLRPLLQLFCAGEYLITRRSLESWYYTDDYTESFVHYYPFDGDVLVPTRSTSDLDPSTVDGYVKSIENGRRPIVVLASVERSWCQFVVDGHHKLEAYNRTSVMPHVLDVHGRGSRMTQEEGEAILRGAEHSSALEIYRTVKAKYDGEPPETR